MVQEDKYRPASLGWRGERSVEPSQGRGVEFTVRRAGDHGIEQHNIDGADRTHQIERVAGRRISLLRQRSAKKFAAIMIAGNCRKRKLQLR